MPTIYSFLLNRTSKKKHKTIEINKVDDLFHIAFELIKDDDYIYRGINAEEQKYPKIIRDKDLSKYEAGFLSDFEKYYGLYSQVHNFWEFIALAQHHGLKTRLIDFTKNIFVATFFSLYKKSKSGVYKIFVFRKQHLKRSGEWNMRTQYISEPDDSMADNVMIAFNNFKETGGDYLLTTHYSNNRIFVQQGLFVIPGVLTVEHIKRFYDLCDIEIVISSKIRKYVLDRLKKFGYDECRLMPDLDNTCYDINSSYDD